MSWNFNAIGRAASLRTKVAADFTKIKCSEPEEAIKNMVASALDAALAAFPPDYAVKIEASGSQSNGSKPEEKTNQLSVKLQPIYSFIQ